MASEYDPLTISDEDLKKLPPAERARVYKARAAARGAGAPPAAAGQAAAGQAAAGARPAAAAASGPAEPAGQPAQPSAAAAQPATPSAPAQPPAAAQATQPGQAATAAQPGAAPPQPAAPAQAGQPARAGQPGQPAQPAPPAAQARPAAPAQAAATAPAQAAATAPAQAAAAAPGKPAAPAPEPEKPQEPPFVQRVLRETPDSAWQWRHGYAEMRVPRAHLLATARRLRAEGFDYLSFVTEVDWRDKLELVYHIFSYDFARQPLGVILRTELPREGMPEVASLTTVWPGAEFMEREAFEMMGIRFIGHPDLRRILLPDDFVGFPMRKDYETDWEYITVKQLVRELENRTS